MNKQQDLYMIPQLNCSLEIDSSLGWTQDWAKEINQAAQHRITQDLHKLCQELGIPASPAVSVSIINERFQHLDQFIRVLVNDQLCHFSNDLLKKTYSYVSGTPLLPISVNQISARLAMASEDNKTKRGVDLALIIDFFTLTCIEIIKNQISLLFGRTQALAYHANLLEHLNNNNSGDSNITFDHVWLSKILKEVLNQGISIFDLSRVAAVIAAGLVKNRNSEELVEDLIEVLQTNIIEIQLPENYLREISSADTDSTHDKFELMRDGLFYELGIRFPDFQFCLSNDFHATGFAFKINHLITIPRIGLHKEEILVNETMERLELFNIQVAPTLNPAYWYEYSIIHKDDLKTLDSSNYTTWGQLDYLVLCLSADLRENRVRFVHMNLVNNHIEQLESAFSKLLAMVRERYTLEQLTQILRLCIAEEISIRNFRFILESLLDYDFIVTDPSQYIVFDDRLPMARQPDQTKIYATDNLVAFLRTCLKKYISHKYARGGTSLTVYLLDPEIEKWITENYVNSADESNISPSYQDKYNKIIHAVYHEIYETTSSYRSANAILTSIDVREPLHKIIAPEFPQIPVIAYQELAPDISIQPISRISI